MVQQVLTDDGRAGAVEVDGGDIRRVVGDEEIAIYRRQHTQQHYARDAQTVGQRQHRYHHGTLGVDQYRHGKEDQRDSPRIVLDDTFQHRLNLRHIMTEIGVGHPCDTVDSYHGYHTGLPYRTGYGFLGAGLAEDDHQRGGRNHDDLDDLVHLEALQVGHLGQEDSEHHHHCQCAKEDKHAVLGRLRDLTIQGCGRITINIRALLGIGYLSLEDRVFVQVQTAFVGRCSSGHQSAQACRDGNHQHLRDSHVKAVGIGYRDKGYDRGCDRRTGDTHLRCDRGYTARTLGTDALLERDVADDWHQGIDYVARSDQDGQEECGQRCQEGDAARMLT